MKSEDWDKLLEQGLSGGPPRPGFREEVLGDSLAAFVRGRRSHARRRAAVLSAAAVLIAAASFLLGRSSQPPAEMPTVALRPPVVSTDRTTAVPSELVAWLEAARFFKQLGMEDRAARAQDHVSRLLPSPSGTACAGPTQMFAARGAATVGERRPAGPSASSGVPWSVEDVSRVMAQSLGD